MTIEEFERFIYQPENHDRLFEFVDGQPIEKVSSPYHSSIAVNVMFQIQLFVRENNIESHITGAGGGYQIAGECYIPDVAYMPATKQPVLDKDGYNSTPPDLAVEVLSSNTNAELNKLRIKITNYLSVGTTVWVVKPDDRQIEVHQTGQPVTIYRKDDTLNAGDILPDFTMALSDVFGQLEE